MFCFVIGVIRCGIKSDMRTIRTGLALYTWYVFHDAHDTIGKQSLMELLIDYIVILNPHLYCTCTHKKFPP